ncbi:MAG: NADH-quinone oxidoreductase subunit NuoI [Meiothermus silvanus]|nr:NADH-quinone oxidoreductase subunit NuoI [Allomeiothermus silvanus]
MSSVAALAQSLGITLRALFSKPVTIPYPDAPVPLKPRWHGRHVLTRHPNGLEKCIGCSLCAAICPAYAIYVEGAENPPDNPISIGERYAKTWVVNYLRCIFCGFCVEACPTEALQMKQVYELSEYTRAATIYTKEMLLQPVPKKDPADSWMPG